MITLNKKVSFTFGISMILLLVTTGCTPEKFQKRIDENEKNNQEIIENSKSKEEATPEDTDPEDVKLSAEQLEILNDLEMNTPEAAAKESMLEVRTEVDINIPENKSQFQNKDEFSQFISYYFYQYHTNKIRADDFYKTVSPHFHEDFIELLPQSEDDRINMFNKLQATFIDYLPSAIVDYKVSNTMTDPRSNETSLFRMYTLKNTEKIYYMTILRPVGNQWLLVDDSPTPPYEISDAVKSTFKNLEGETKND